MKKRRDKTPYVVGFLVLAIVVFAVLSHQKPFLSAPDAAFADSGPSGSKGLALLLQRTGYAAKVQDAPLQTMPPDARVWLILGPRTRFSRREAQQLLDWVKAGNTLIYSADRGRRTSIFDAEPDDSQAPTTGIEVLASKLEIGDTAFSVQTSANTNAGLPELTPLKPDVPSNLRAGVKGASGSARQFEVGRPSLEIARAPGAALLRMRYGQGQVWALPDGWMLTNYGLSKPDNAVLASNLVRLSAPKGAVYFDERQNGEDGRPPMPDNLIARLKKPPISYALWQLLGAGLLVWAFASRRLGAAVPLPRNGPVTRASQFAQAMGALFSKTNRPRAAAAILGDTFRKRLAQRVGLSPAEPDEVLARRAHELSGVPFAVVDRLLLQTRTPPANEAQALRDAQEMNAVLERLEGRI